MIKLKIQKKVGSECTFSINKPNANITETDKGNDFLSEDQHELDSSDFSMRTEQSSFKSKSQESFVRQTKPVTLMKKVSSQTEWCSISASIYI